MSEAIFTPEIGWYVSCVRNKVIPSFIPQGTPLNTELTLKFRINVVSQPHQVFEQEFLSGLK